ncbi:ABC transporter permease subunit [Modestobacter sp. I12A-02628]|uniref:ABC transporter permease subunit n=1 Tax=Goekera deserti TaxID=2497753 RepID=A0A7K3WF22_9ACTN|nr:ABC transporter permease subunit [Goekera deserti]MPQ97977.1 ABC transporter permease subunit [Goekera deserti]NDI48624.1 ABC transporter permease subunit [Goekera deserti]NEL54997.1 ABC transporter permease subunit [Goekera deserti]
MARPLPRPGTAPGWPALPAVVLVLAVVGAGLVTVLLQALGLLPLIGVPRLSGAAFGDVGRDLGTGTALSLAIAAASTAVAAVVGLATALLLTGRRWLGAAAALTVPVPHLVGAAAMGLLLADSGVLARWTGMAGWPELVGGRWWVAVVAEYAWKESAFVALLVAGALAGRLGPLRETAALLGAGPWRRLRHVTLPLAAPALLAACTISFVYAFGSYEVAALLGRASPEPLPVLAYRLSRSIQLTERPQAAAAAVVLVVVGLAVVAVAAVALRRSLARTT